ncbi:hypothetical protein TKK_0014085 [Trichogramma kaykai]
MNLSGRPRTCGLEPQAKETYVTDECVGGWAALVSRKEEDISWAYRCIGRYTEMAPQTRSSSLPQLTVPDSSSEVRRRSFSIMGARVWNELPLAVRNVESLPQFPRRLRAHLASCR